VGCISQKQNNCGVHFTKAEQLRQPVTLGKGDLPANQETRRTRPGSGGIFPEEAKAAFSATAQYMHITTSITSPNQKKKKKPKNAAWATYVRAGIDRRRELLCVC
jgi:hypothetical protein